MTEQMTSNKPYIVRAFYDWIVDNQLTPYIAVDTSIYGVIVPLAYVRDDQIVLNIAPVSVGAISLVGNAIEFSARFGGKLEHLVVPYAAISAIYAKENGAGTQLAIEHVEPEDSADIASLETVTSEKPAKSQPKPKLSSVNSNSEATKATGDSEANKGKTRPSLKVIK